MSIPNGILVGMGNPLLDIQVSIGKDFLDKYQLKGNDAILAEKHHLPMYQELPKMEGVQYIPGGATQNVLRAFQWVVGEPNKAVFFGSIGNDEFGKTLTKEATSAGVDVHYQIHDNEKTGVCGVLVYEHHRSLVTDLLAAQKYTIDHLEKTENWDRVEKAQYYYISGYFLSTCPPALMKVANHAVETNKPFMVNLSAPFIPFAHKKELDDALPYIDILFGNRSEAEAYADSHGWNTHDLKEIALKLANSEKVNKKRSRTVVITNDEHPIIVVHDGGIEEFPVKLLPSEVIVDTNGAGDGFVGGFLAELVKGKPLKDSIECGCYAAQEVIQQSGCTFPKHCQYK